jgi:hypothetical protein
VPTLRPAGFAARAAFAAGLLLAVAAGAVPLTAEELAKLCTGADDASHCGRLVEGVQLKRLPNLAVRDKSALRVSLYPSGTSTFTDTETLTGGRSYSLWDFFSEINAVVLYVTDDDEATFLLLQRTNGRQVTLPADPKLSPDRARLVTADFCEQRCSNEVALWRVTRDGVRKESSWRPPEAWLDGVASWADAETVVIDFTPAGGQKPSRLSRRLDDRDWIRPPKP